MEKEIKKDVAKQIKKITYGMTYKGYKRYKDYLDMLERLRQFEGIEIAKERIKDKI